MANRTCAVEGCEKAVRTRGWCNAHYQRYLAYGSPTASAQRKSVEERFWAKVEKTDTCWLWTGYSCPLGYGQMWVNPRRVLVHRWAYEELVGPIPPGLVIDHLCRNPSCVNPDHLEVVTQAENVLRGQSPPARNARKTHCPQGHLYDEANTYIRGGARRCMACDPRGPQAQAHRAKRGW